MRIKQMIFVGSVAEPQISLRNFLQGATKISVEVG